MCIDLFFFGNYSVGFLSFSWELLLLFQSCFQVICTECDKISYRYENMMDLTVEIQGDVASLEDCLDQFTVKEWLDGENMYKCDGYASFYVIKYFKSKQIFCL